MKQIYTYILLIFCITLIGCTESYDEGLGLYPTLVPRYISVSPTSFTFEAKTSETKHISISSTETPWKIDNSVDWINLSANSGNSTSSIRIGVKENTSGDDARLGIFYVKSNADDWKYESPITVSQAGTIPYISTENNEFDLPGSINEKSFSVASNCSWEVTSNSSWLTCSKNGDKVSFSTTPNETTTYRNGVITLSHTGNRYTSSNIIVRQAPASITASTETLTFNNTAGIVEVTVNAEASWTASTSSSWIEITPSSGNAGTSVMKINVSPNTSTNERTGYVILAVDGTQRIQIPIRQRGIYVEVDKTNMSFNAKGESHSINISSNTNWVVKDLPNWATASVSSGNGDANVTITASANNSTNQRSAIFKVTQDGVTVGNSITITQEGKFFDVSAQSLTFEDVASTKSIEIRAEDSWTLQNDNAWIKVSQASGNGTSILNITVDDNETEYSRNGYIYVTMLDKSIIISVTQKERVFNTEVDCESLVFAHSGGNSNLNILSNTRWYILDYPLWISLSQSQGKGNSSIIVTANENYSIHDRTGTMILKMEGDSSTTVINIKQYGKSISISPTNLEFTSYADIQNVNIESDWDWVARTSDSWISLSPRNGIGSSVLMVSVLENTTNITRTGTISVVMGSKTTDISILQEGKHFTISNSDLSYNSKGGSIEISVSTNDSWTANVENGEKWISISETSGKGNANIKVIALDNPSLNSRLGYVVIKTPHGQSVRVQLTQAARYLTIDNNSLLFYSKGGTSEAVTVSTDGTYSITSSVEWLSINQSANTFTVTASENSGVDARFGNITITLTDLKEDTYSLGIDVTQLSKSGSFIKKDYDDDIDWDNTGNIINSLTITPCGENKNNDVTKSGYSMGTKLSINSY